MGVRAGRQGHSHRGRRRLLPHHGQPLLQGPSVHSGGLPPRPHQVPHEAHEPQGRRRSRLGAHFLGRGLPDHRRQHSGDHREVRQRVHLHLVRHGPSVVHAVRCRHGAASVRHPEHRGRLPGVQGPAPLRQPHRQCAGLVVVGADQPLHEVRAVGHRAVAVELRRRSPYRGGRRPLRRRLHLGGSAPDEPGTYRQVLAAAAPRAPTTRWRSAGATSS